MEPDADGLRRQYHAIEDTSLRQYATGHVMKLVRLTELLCSSETRYVYTWYVLCVFSNLYIWICRWWISARNVLANDRTQWDLHDGVRGEAELCYHPPKKCTYSPFWKCMTSVCMFVVWGTRRSFVRDVYPCGSVVFPIGVVGVAPKNEDRKSVVNFYQEMNCR